MTGEEKQQKQQQQQQNWIAVDLWWRFFVLNREVVRLFKIQLPIIEF